jgi:hypothetical protein
MSKNLFVAAYKWNHKGFKEYVAEIANRLGHDVG